MRFRITYFAMLLYGIVQAQDPGFSQYYAAPMYLNPAFVGDKQNMSFAINSRNFTNKAIANYSLVQFTGIVPITADFLKSKNSNKEKFSGSAVSVYREATGANGELNSLGAILTFGQSIQLAQQHVLSLGLQAGVISKTQGGNFQWGSQYSEDFGYDPTVIPSVTGLQNLRTTFPTFNAGLEYFFNASATEDYFKRYDFDIYVGFACYNVNTPNQSFFKETNANVPLNYKFNAGMKYNASKQFALFPTIYVSQQNKNTQTNLGMYANIRTVQTKKARKDVVNIITGVWYRVGDSFITTFGFTWYDMKLAVSYDFNASNFDYNSRGKGATEVSLKYTVETKKTKRFTRGMMYPAF